MAKAKKAEKVGECSVYSVKRKEVVNVVDEARITKNPNGTFMLRGLDDEGNNVAGIIGKDKCASLLKKKLADKDY